MLKSIKQRIGLTSLLLMSGFVSHAYSVDSHDYFLKDYSELIVINWCANKESPTACVASGNVYCNCYYQTNPFNSSLPGGWWVSVMTRTACQSAAPRCYVQYDVDPSWPNASQQEIFDARAAAALYQTGYPAACDAGCVQSGALTESTWHTYMTDLTGVWGEWCAKRTRTCVSSTNSNTAQ